MFTKKDLERIDARIPEDFDEKAREFWGYVEERLSAVSGRLKKVYLESSGVVGKRHMEMLRVTDPRQYEVVKRILDGGAELVEVEAAELVLETISWMQRMQELLSSGEEGGPTGLQTIGEFLKESMEERDEFVKRRVDETLGEGEVGVMFMDMSRQIEFPSDIRVVITCPFRPHDYLNSWLATLGAKDRAKAAEEKAKSKDEEKGKDAHA